jgi:hypothetical protein
VSDLEFDFQDTIAEVDALQKIIEPFCQPGSVAVLQELSSTLQSIRDTPSDAHFYWGIRESRPFLTAVSRGEYQSDDQGALNVFAEITSTWTIRRVPPRKRSLRAATFLLTGNASTRVRFHRQPTEQAAATKLAMWRAEVGDAASPGCHFHVQIAGDSADPPFPKSLDVPRLPGLLVTPPSVVEYVVGELFQEQWLKHIARRGADLNRWWPIQQRRLGAVLGWQLNVVEKAAGSPWTTLKKAKPHPALFVEARRL